MCYNNCGSHHHKFNSSFGQPCFLLVLVKWQADTVVPELKHVCSDGQLLFDINNKMLFSFFVETPVAKFTGTGFLKPYLYLNRIENAETVHIYEQFVAGIATSNPNLRVGFFFK